VFHLTKATRTAKALRTPHREGPSSGRKDVALLLIAVELLYDHCMVT